MSADQKGKRIGMKGDSLMEKGKGPSTTLTSEKGLVNGPPMSGSGDFRPRTRRPLQGRKDGDSGH